MTGAFSDTIRILGNATRIALRDVGVGLSGASFVAVDGTLDRLELNGFVNQGTVIFAPRINQLTGGGTSYAVFVGPGAEPWIDFGTINFNGSLYGRLWVREFENFRVAGAIDDDTTLNPQPGDPVGGLRFREIPLGKAVFLGSNLQGPVRIDGVEKALMGRVIIGADAFQSRLGIWNPEAPILARGSGTTIHEIRQGYTQRPCLWGGGTAGVTGFQLTYGEAGPTVLPDDPGAPCPAPNPVFDPQATDPVVSSILQTEFNQFRGLYDPTPSDPNDPNEQIPTRGIKITFDGPVQTNVPAPGAPLRLEWKAPGLIDIPDNWIVIDSSKYYVRVGRTGMQSPMEYLTIFINPAYAASQMLPHGDYRVIMPLPSPNFDSPRVVSGGLSPTWLNPPYFFPDDPSTPGVDEYAAVAPQVLTNGNSPVLRFKVIKDNNPPDRIADASQDGNTDQTAGRACIADLTDPIGGPPDGGVGIEDLLLYLQYFADGTLQADITNGNDEPVPDGGVGIEDLLYYIFRYSLGC